MDMIQTITYIPLFEGLPENYCESLASIALKQKFSRGQMFFSEGDEGIGFYIILSGKVKVFKLSADGKEQILHILEDQEPFGEAAVFAGEHYPASAQALVETSVFFFPRPKFVDLILRQPSLAMNMLALLSLRLRKLTILVENLSLKEVPGRLAAYLLFLNDRNNHSATIELDISKNQMAGLLGTIPETVSRILKRMNEEKLIKMKTRSISIIDKKGMTNLAEGLRKLV